MASSRPIHKLANKLSRKWESAVALLPIFCLFGAFSLFQTGRHLLAYFKLNIQEDLGFNEAHYGLLAGYATSLWNAFTAILIGYLVDNAANANSDYDDDRVYHSRFQIWSRRIRLLINRRNIIILSLFLWSSIFLIQTFSKTTLGFSITRIGMSIFSATSESLLISLISDLSPSEYGSLSQSALLSATYLSSGVASFSSAFTPLGMVWRTAFQVFSAIGFFLVILMFFVLEEPKTKRLLSSNPLPKRSIIYTLLLSPVPLLIFSAAIREIASFVTTAYMNSYLEQAYPNHVTPMKVSYGFIYLFFGSVSCISGGYLAARYDHQKQVACYIAAFGALVASVLIFGVLYPPLSEMETYQSLPLSLMSLALTVLTSEMWLGPILNLYIVLIGHDHKTLGISVFQAVIMILGSSGPEIVGILFSVFGRSLRSMAVVLGCLISGSYFISAMAFIVVSFLVQRNVKNFNESRIITKADKIKVTVVVICLSAGMIALTIISLRIRGPDSINP